MEAKPVHIEDRLESMEQKIDRLLVLMGDSDDRMISLQEIADICHCSRQSLYKGKRYLLPDFGQGLKEGRRYTRGEFYRWISKGEEALYREWRNGGIA